MKRIILEKQRRVPWARVGNEAEGMFHGMRGSLSRSVIGFNAGSLMLGKSHEGNAIKSQQGNKGPKMLPAQFIFTLAVTLWIMTLKVEWDTKWGRLLSKQPHDGPLV